MKEMTVKDNFINLSDVKEIPHAELFREVAKVIAEDTLQYINEHDKKVLKAIGNHFIQNMGSGLLIS